MKRLSKNDWALLYEALDMLCLDYELDHPEQGRINELLDYAASKAYMVAPTKEIENNSEETEK